MKRFIALCLGLLMAGSFSCEALAAADTVYNMRLSVDSNENHHRNKGLKIFINLLEKNSNGRIKVQFFENAQIYKDKDIPKAIKMGTIDMACPGSWLLEGVEPNMALTGLPMFLGIPEEFNKKIMDAEAGEFLTKRLEKVLNCVIPGKWYYHGNQIVCNKVRPFRVPDDMKGLKIRHAGGMTNALRIEACGGSPVMIPWSDLSMAIIGGTADGFSTTSKSYDSAKLWDTGAKYCTYTRELYSHYVPLISSKFWKSLPADLQKILVDTWAEHLPQEREIADNEQRMGAESMVAHGIEAYYPTREEFVIWRNQVMTVQDRIVKDSKMDENFVNGIKKLIDAEMAKL